VNPNNRNPLYDLAAELAEPYDGNTVHVGPFRVTLGREPDTHTRINDFDAYGTVAPVERDPYICHDAPRPDGFTGNAEKLHLPDGERYWWEPPLDFFDVTVAQWRTDRKLRDSIRPLVIEILTWGFDVYTMRLEGPDIDIYDALGAVDPNPTGAGLLPDVVVDMLYNVLGQLRFHDQQVFDHHLNRRAAMVA
jgi:hypothetical protein